MCTHSEFCIVIKLVREIYIFLIAAQSLEGEAVLIQGDEDEHTMPTVPEQEDEEKV